MKKNKKLRLIQTSFFVPIKEDKYVGNGELHPYFRWERLQNELWKEFGSYTLAPGDYSGVYPDLDTGERVEDLSRRYIIAVEREELDKLRDFLKDVVGALFRQKCIYFEVRGEVELIESNLNNLDRLP